ncbi:MoaD family protein [Novipirellula artificiosorum]|uniref:MoaD family protein n=1 Tax=Novipirellula artificiosorum TaxID=2528016 RepID=UPI0018CEE1D8|nr:MoaD family protein [Novipirellula artificiosorum]
MNTANIFPRFKDDLTLKVRIPTVLRKHTDNQPMIELAGANVAQLLVHLQQQYPELATQLFDDGGRLASYVNVFVNDKNIRDLQDVDTVLKQGDEVLLVPAIAGG